MKRLSSGPGSRRRRPSRRTIKGRPRLLVLALGLLMGLAVIAPAGQASEAQDESLAAQVQRASRQAVRAAEKADRAAVRAAQKNAEKLRRQNERLARREAKRHSRDAFRLGLKEKEGNVVTIDCTKVTAAYHGFNAVPGNPNLVQEWISIKNPPESISKDPITFPERRFEFETADATDVIPIAFPVGHYVVDVHAKWDTNGHKGNYDIHGNVTCVPSPGYAIEKLQSIAGSGQQPTTATLTGKVGQVVDYSILATNTGNTPLTFSNFKDTRCDAGTIAGGSLAPIEPSETLTYTCTHTLTAADQAAGFYMNVATVSGTPEEDEGGTITRESNAVVVTPVGPAEKPKEEPKEEPKEKPEEKPPPKTEPKGEVLGTTTTNTPTASTGTTTSKGGVLGFTSATVPALKGPQGCVRSGFVVGIRSNGVSSVIFYLDGHRMGRLTYKNAHKGMLSIRINPAKLKVGPHRLMATITMKQSSPSAKAARASRRLTVIRCKSASLTPRFTG